MQSLARSKGGSRQVHYVSIAGFYGVNNVGDEGILKVMIDQLSSIPNVRLHILALEPRSIKKEYNINSSNCMWHRDVFGFLRTMSRCDLFILGGGELIHDYSTWRHPIFGVLPSKIFQNKAMTYAVSARPFRSRIGETIFRKALESFDVITVRDGVSKNYLNSLGLTKKIWVTADPTLLLEPRSIETQDFSKYGIPTTSEIKIGINIRRLRNVSEGKLEEQIAEICDSLVRQIDARIVFFPLQVKGEFSDLIPTLAIKNLMKAKEQVSIAQYPPDPQLVMTLLGQMNVILGMRLHSIIFALKMGVPVVAISYSPKVSGFMKMISQEKMCIPVEHLNPNIATKKVIYAFDNRATIVKAVSKKIQELFGKAELNMVLARRLLDQSEGKAN